jgi:hypothetical protein
MARLARVSLVDIPQHIIQRGNNRQKKRGPGSNYFAGPKHQNGSSP